MSKFKFSYDKENDDLFLFNPNCKSKGSVELGDIILDYDNKKELVGLQIMNASQLIKEMLFEETVDSVAGVLNNLKECKVETRSKNNVLIVKIYLFSTKRKISPVISLPTIREQSPALAYA